LGNSWWYWLLNDNYEWTIAIGSCAEVAQRAREIFSEMLAGILALLLAARPPNDKPPRQEDK
jgi:hypothetical protein